MGIKGANLYGMLYNVDYRTIDDKCVDKILSADYSNGIDVYVTSTQNQIEKYITEMKKNKTIIESSKIAVNGSSLYYYNGRYVLSVYVKYRIVSSNLKYGVDVDTIINENSYSKLLYTRHPLIISKVIK